MDFVVRVRNGISLEYFLLFSSFDECVQRQPEARATVPDNIEANNCTKPIAMVAP